MTTQELQLKSMLQAIGVPFEMQLPIAVGTSVIVVDFCVNGRYLVECCYSDQTVQGAMGMLRRSAAYIDWKARSVHRQYGTTYLLGAVLEAPNVPRRVLERAFTPLLEDVDFVFFDVGSFGEYLVGLRPSECSRSNPKTSPLNLDLWSVSPAAPTEPHDPKTSNHRR
jgi:hypothetical protein